MQALAASLAKMQSQPVAAYDLSQVDMIATVRKFMETIQPGDFVLIYFSGYGYQDPASGLNYLLPVGFDVKDRTAISQRALAVRSITSRLEERKAGTKMLLLDASREAPGLPTGLTLTAPGEHSVISYSAGLNGVTLDPPGGGVNVYTAALIRALETPGSTPTNVVSRTQSDVNRDSGGKQLPFVIQTPVEDLVFTPAPARAADVGVRTQQSAATPIPTPPFLPLASQPADRKPGDRAIDPKDKLIYAWVPPGSFLMGCSNGDNECEGNEKPAHPVKISKGFWMGQTEVTQEAYRKLMGKDPASIKAAKLPVDNVTWEEARNYCQAAGMRLPTEAEWEWAARAGGTGSRYGDLYRIAWYRGNTGGQEREVGLKQPNAWGLYDMLGNVWEWVADWYADRYEAGSAADPQGPSSGKAHTVRGGSSLVIPLYARVSYRDRAEPNLSSIGFRCAGN